MTTRATMGEKTARVAPEATGEALSLALLPREKKKAALDIIRANFESGDEVREFYVFFGDDERSSEEPLKLLCVSEGTFHRERVDAFGFREPGMKHILAIADVHPKDLVKFRRSKKSWPRGWNLSRAVRVTRDDVRVKVGGR